MYFLKQIIIQKLCICALQQAVQQIIEMYAKNNLGTLGKLHSNALMKSQSPIGFKYKPLSQIQNSLQKLKAKKKKGSKSKSRSKQNTPQNEKSIQRRSSIGNQKNNIYINKQQQKPKQSIISRHQKKVVGHFGQHINSIVSNYDNTFTKTSSQLSINSKNLAQSNASSCVSSEYQLSMNSQMSQKSVKFSDKYIQMNMSKMNSRKINNKQQDRLRTPSILKKRLSTNSVNSQRSNSVRSSVKLSRARDLIEMENVSANKLLKAKYQALLKKYEDLNKKFGKNQSKNYNKLQKYTDDIFPPQNSSIFSYSIHNKALKPKNNLVWKRIPQLYLNNENLIVLRQQKGKSLIKITRKDVKNQQSLINDYFLTSFNCIRQNKKLLEKIFEIKQLNLYGFYLVKIFSENVWKYIVIDDLIPTIFDQAKQIYIPAFLNVQKAEGNTSDTIEIWPYLLQKAFAVYYSKYQALQYGTQIDFLSQLTGVPSKCVKTTQINIQNKQHIQLQNLLRQERAIILGEKIVDQKSTFYCILPDLNSITKKSQGFCTILTKQKSYKPTKQKLQTFLLTLSKIYIYQIDLYNNINISYLCPQNKKSTQGSFRSKKSIQTQIKQDTDVSLRCFTVTQMTKGIISLRQKDCRFYIHGKVQYKYIWVRAILLLKQHNEDYRWIDGQYSNNKSLSFNVNLQPGQYYLLLMPQWNTSYKYDITISFYTQSNSVQLQKRPYFSTQQIFQKGCADIAQRLGSMNQINKYICAYNYVTQKCGLVIQNINNQRQNGPVTVMRSINGLKCQVSLIAVNKQFYINTNTDYDTEPGKKMKKTIQVDIQANQHFTVVLKTVGGIDHKFFDSFDFGS